MWFRTSLLSLTLIAAPAVSQAQAAPAAAKVLVNTDKAGLALQGYDPVAFFTLQRPTLGLDSLTAVHQGATYRFSSAEHRSMFLQDPGKYEPAFGGYCAYAVSVGSIAPIDVTTFQILHGQLVLNKNPEILELFNRDRESRYQKANANWPDIVERKGK